MRSQTRAQTRAAERRQRLQIGGGALAVAAIWTLALWPSDGGGSGPQGAPGRRPAFVPWTTGPFVGTTPSVVPATPSSPVTSIPTVVGTPVAPRVSGGTATVAPRRAPVTSVRASTTSPSPTSGPKRGNRPTLPPGQQ